MKHNILIVEDEKEIADTLSYALNSAGMQSAWVSTGSEATISLERDSFNLCVLDVGLPDCHGFDLLKEIRLSDKDYATIPVLFLTARSEEIDRILGLELGADDYVCKPFSPREVVARIKTILQRSESVPRNHQTEKEPAALDSQFNHVPEQRLIYLDNASLDLTRAEYTLLATFLERPNRVFTRRQLIEIIWSNNHPSDDRAIDTHIKTLRSKLKSSNPHRDYIVTHRGFGYSLEL
jgi:two-component system catabolic regulation response regulator CreB